MRFMMAVNLQASKPSVKQIFYYFADLLKLDFRQYPRDREDYT